MSSNEIEAEIAKLWPKDQIQPTACKLRMVLIFLKGCFRKWEE